MRNVQELENHLASLAKIVGTLQQSVEELQDTIARHIEWEGNVKGDLAGVHDELSHITAALLHHQLFPPP